MTPTLWGRWQTRFLLLGTVGGLVTLIFGYIFANFVTPLLLLGYVLGVGFGWDILYNYLQMFRWDRDWPPPFQLAAGIGEGVFLWLLVKATFFWQILGWNSLPGLNPAQITVGMFVAHYATVWLTTFLASQGPLRVIFPRWRFRGGEWL